MANEPKFDQITKARAWLVHAQPFFGVLCLQLAMQPTEEIPTLVVDGKTIFYNPKFVAGLTFDLTCSAMCHEILHCVFEHIGRRGSRDPQRWNYAGDYVINPLIKEMGMKIGDSWLYDDKYKGMSADEVYTKLPQALPKSDFVCEIGNGPGKGGKDSEPSPDDVAQVRAAWKVATVQAAMLAKQQGKLPGSLERFIEDITAPQVDWKEQLRHLLTTFCPSDYSWARPNRRHVAAGIYLPSVDGQSMGRIVCAIDTSGSITQSMLNTFGSEIVGIRDSVLPSAFDIIYCDSAINHVDEFEQHDELHFKMHGGGGTDFRPPFDWVEQQSEKPACLVYLTDLEGPAPQSAPGYPVIWCCTTKKEGPWGVTVHVKA